MRDIGASIVVASVLSCAVYWLLGRASLILMGAMVSPRSRHPIVPRILALVIAWLLALPACFVIIDNTSLRTMIWGHAGELFILPYLLCTVIVFSLFISRLQKHDL